MKVIFNYATRQFEPMEPTLRDRFVLGGRVNFDKGSPFPITDEVLKQIDDLIKNTNLNLKEIGKNFQIVIIDTPPNLLICFDGTCFKSLEVSVFRYFG